MSESRIKNILTEKTVEAIKKLYEQSISPNQITLQKTRTEFEGDITLLVFPLIKASKKSPDETAHAIGTYLKENVSLVKSFNVVKGFLNLVIDDSYWLKFLSCIKNEKEYGMKKKEQNSETAMIEFSSPNTNKPLHLGHVRNNLLGSSLANILKASGKNVIRVNLVNDRGIHICKSMLAWKLFGEEETPLTTKDPKLKKGDHFVGHYYVRYHIAELEANQLFSKLLSSLSSLSHFFIFPEADIKYLIEHPETVLIKINEVRRGNKVTENEKKVLDNAYEEIKCSVYYQVKEMLRKWEAGDKDTIDLWKKMNGWVYDGFAKTYKELGVEFEKTYYESKTYLLGKRIVEEGLSKGVFKKREDGSVWIDLTADGLDEKLLLRSDGTSVYMTQDLGTAILRQEEFNFNRKIYVVGNEQDYHFKVLFLILKKLGYDWAKNLFHLSYGMVDLPSGKMKSREGTVVDADELMDEMINSARETTKALGKTDGMSEAEAETLYHTIGLGALKYFILKVDAKKRMLFNPEESIDFNGNTGPFIQYTYARIKSVLRKAEESGHQSSAFGHQSLVQKEKEVIKRIYDFPSIVREAAEGYNPGHIANYVYDLAKEYNQFYHENPILKAEKEEEKCIRLALSAKTAEVIKSSLKLLGIDVPERM